MKAATRNALVYGCLILSGIHQPHLRAALDAHLQLLLRFHLPGLRRRAGGLLPGARGRIDAGRPAGAPPLPSPARLRMAGTRHRRLCRAPPSPSSSSCTTCSPCTTPAGAEPSGLAFRFLAAAAVLAVPTLCMGATFPILLEHLRRERSHLSEALGRLYGINTLGAFLGVYLATHWLIPGAGPRQGQLLRRGPERPSSSSWFSSLAAAAPAAAGLAPMSERPRPHIGRRAPRAPGRGGADPPGRFRLHHPHVRGGLGPRPHHLHGRLALRHRHHARILPGRHRPGRRGLLPPGPPPAQRRRAFSTPTWPSASSPSPTWPFRASCFRSRATCSMP